MAKRSIWNNSPWDPTGGRARRGRTSIGAGDLLRLAIAIGAVAIATGIAIAVS